MRRRSNGGPGTLFKTIVLFLYLVIAIYLYVRVVLLYFGAWKTWFMRTGNILYYVYLTVFSWIYVQIIKILWKWQVRALT